MTTVLYCSGLTQTNSVGPHPIGHEVYEVSIIMIPTRQRQRVHCRGEISYSTCLVRTSFALDVRNRQAGSCSSGRSACTEVGAFDFARCGVVSNCQTHRQRNESGKGIQSSPVQCYLKRSCKVTGGLNATACQVKFALLTNNQGVRVYHF